MRITFPVAGALLAATVFALAGCGQEEGQANPGKVTDSQITAPQSTSTQEESQLSEAKACDLLTKSEATNAIGKGLEKSDVEPVGGESSACEWSTSIDSNVPIEKGITMAISIRPEQSVHEVVVQGKAKVSDRDLAGRQAKLVEENSGAEGGCMMSFAAENGRIDIIARSYNTQRSCTAVKDVATIIEPKLPE
ncbi:DUF3558 family protein [Haloechinothrix salitolerans]|uniref:DUF3558 family protein n=1 Tax=Haloechinothrix salitolerans TaxID=926830 RepID=A0ABW2CC88_9PSEU